MTIAVEPETVRILRVKDLKQETVKVLAINQEVEIPMVTEQGVEMVEELEVLIMIQMMEG